MNGGFGGRLSDWSDAGLPASAEFAEGQVFVDVLVVVDGPVRDVEAEVGGGIDASCRRGVKDHLEFGEAVGGQTAESDGEDVGVHELGLGSNEPVGFPNVGHTFAAHVVGGLEGHGDRGGRGHSGLIRWYYSRACGRQNTGLLGHL